MTNQSIVFSICEKHNVPQAEFFGPTKSQRVVRARIDAIFTLKDAGFNGAAIARLIHRNIWTIHYWMNKPYRERARVRAIARKRVLKARAEVGGDNPLGDRP